MLPHRPPLWTASSESLRASVSTTTYFIIYTLAKKLCLFYSYTPLYTAPCPQEYYSLPPIYCLFLNKVFYSNIRDLCVFYILVHNTSSIYKWIHFIIQYYCIKKESKHIRLSRFIIFRLLTQFSGHQSRYNEENCTHSNAVPYRSHTTWRAWWCRFFPTPFSTALESRTPWSCHLYYSSCSYVPHFFYSLHCLEVYGGRSTGDRDRIKSCEEDGEQMGLREARSGKRTARAMAGITRRMQRREFRRRKFVIRRDFFAS